MGFQSQYWCTEKNVDLYSCSTSEYMQNVLLYPTNGTRKVLQEKFIFKWMVLIQSKIQPSWLGFDWTGARLLPWYILCANQSKSGRGYIWTTAVTITSILIAQHATHTIFGVTDRQFLTFTSYLHDFQTQSLTLHGYVCFVNYLMLRTLFPLIMQNH